LIAELSHFGGSVIIATFQYAAQWEPPQMASVEPILLIARKSGCLEGVKQVLLWFSMAREP